MPDSQPQPPPTSGTPASPDGQEDPGVLLLCGARLTDGRTVDVRLGRGRIEAVGTTGSLTAGPSAAPGARVDLGGYLLLP
ncbi:hydrolase, partial [Streptomyces sp. NPDC057052]